MSWPETIFSMNMQHSIVLHSIRCISFKVGSFRSDAVCVSADVVSVNNPYTHHQSTQAAVKRMSYRATSSAQFLSSLITLHVKTNNSQQLVLSIVCLIAIV